MSRMLPEHFPLVLATSPLLQVVPLQASPTSDLQGLTLLVLLSLSKEKGVVGW